MRDEEKHRTADHSQNVPTFFSSFETIESEKVKRIIPNEGGVLEGHPMLRKVGAGLVGIPLKSDHQTNPICATL